MKISLIAAVSENGIIGADGDLPWNLPDDMKFFTRTTKGHHVLMGRVNFESIPPKYRPLPGRENIVITRNKSFKAEGSHVFHTIEEGIEFARKQGEDELFVIGGGNIYTQTIGSADRLYVTDVHAHIDGDTHFPEINSEEWTAQTIAEHSKDDVHNFSFDIKMYERKV